MLERVQRKGHRDFVYPRRPGPPRRWDCFDFSAGKVFTNACESMRDSKAAGTGSACFDAHGCVKRNPGFKNRWLFNLSLWSRASDEIRPE